LRDVERQGYAAFVVDYKQSLKRGLPKTFDFSPNQEIGKVASREESDPLAKAGRNDSAGGVLGSAPTQAPLKTDHQQSNDEVQRCHDRIAALASELHEAQCHRDEWLWCYSLLVSILEGRPGWETAKEYAVFGSDIVPLPAAVLAKEARRAIESTQLSRPGADDKI
jgi:hypothetical protein